MADSKLYAQVILPLPLAGNFTYIVPEHMHEKVQPGHRVLVPFGSRHFYTGIVASVSPVAPAPGVPLKEIAQCLDDKPIVRNSQIRFWEWMADYYLCTVGEVYKAALPAGLKVESETRLEINKDIEPEAFASCSETETEVLEYLRKEKSATAAAIEKNLKIKGVGTLLARMTERGLIVVAEKIVERYRAVRQPYVRILIKREECEAAFASLHRSPKQEEALVASLAQAGGSTCCARCIVRIL